MTEDMTSSCSTPTSTSSCSSSPADSCPSNTSYSTNVSSSSSASGSTTPVSSYLSNSSSKYTLSSSNTTSVHKPTTQPGGSSSPVPVKASPKNAIPHGMCTSSSSTPCFDATSMPSSPTESSTPPLTSATVSMLSSTIPSSGDSPGATVTITTGQAQHSHSTAATIAGGTVGGFVGLTLLLVGLLFWLRCRNRAPKVAPSAEFMAYAAARRNPTPTADLALMRDSSVDPDSPPPTRTSTGSEAYPGPGLEKLLEAVAQMRVLQTKDGNNGQLEEERAEEDLGQV